MCSKGIEVIEKKFIVYVKIKHKKNFELGGLQMEKNNDVMIVSDNAKYLFHSFMYNNRICLFENTR